MEKQGPNWVASVGIINVSLPVNPSFDRTLLVTLEHGDDDPLNHQHQLFWSLWNIMMMISNILILILNVWIINVSQ